MNRPTITTQLDRVLDKLEAMDGRARDFEAATRVTLTELKAAIAAGDGKTAALEAEVAALKTDVHALQIARARGTKIAAGTSVTVATIVAAIAEYLTGTGLL